MRKFARCIVLGAITGLMALSLVTAHAEAGVSITTADGAQLYSLPALPENELGVDYPADFPTTLTGTASFDSEDGSVLVAFYAGGGETADYSGQAVCERDENNACNWTMRVPFIIAPGDYTIVASNGDLTDSVDVSIL